MTHARSGQMSAKLPAQAACSAFTEWQNGRSPAAFLNVPPTISILHIVTAAARNAAAVES